MNPKVIEARAIEAHKLFLIFNNQEQRIFDVTPFLDKGVFRELKDENYFQRVRVVNGSVQWPHEQDLSYDTLFLLSKPFNAAATAS